MNFKVETIQKQKNECLFIYLKNHTYSLISRIQLHVVGHIRTYNHVKTYSCENKQIFHSKCEGECML